MPTKYYFYQVWFQWFMRKGLKYEKLKDDDG